MPAKKQHPVVIWTQFTHRAVAVGPEQEIDTFLAGCREKGMGEVTRWERMPWHTARHSDLIAVVVGTAAAPREGTLVELSGGLPRTVIHLTVTWEDRGRDQEQTNVITDGRSIDLLFVEYAEGGKELARFKPADVALREGK